jgi:hypothetical protein
MDVKKLATIYETYMCMWILHIWNDLS